MSSSTRTELNTNLLAQLDEMYAAAFAEQDDERVHAISSDLDRLHTYPADSWERTSILRAAIDRAKAHKEGRIDDAESRLTATRQLDDEIGAVQNELKAAGNLAELNAWDYREVARNQVYAQTKVVRKQMEQAMRIPAARDRLAALRLIMADASNSYARTDAQERAAIALAAKAETERTRRTAALAKAEAERARRTAAIRDGRTIAIDHDAKMQRNALSRFNEVVLNPAKGRKALQIQLDLRRGPSDGVPLPPEWDQPRASAEVEQAAVAVQLASRYVPRSDRSVADLDDTALQAIAANAQRAEDYLPTHAERIYAIAATVLSYAAGRGGILPKWLSAGTVARWHQIIPKWVQYHVSPLVFRTMDGDSFWANAMDMPFADLVPALDAQPTFFRSFGNIEVNIDCVPHPGAFKRPIVSAGAWDQAKRDIIQAGVSALRVACDDGIKLPLPLPMLTVSVRLDPDTQEPVARTGTAEQRRRRKQDRKERWDQRKAWLKKKVSPLNPWNHASSSSGSSRKAPRPEFEVAFMHSII